MFWRVKVDDLWSKVKSETVSGVIRVFEWFFVK